MSEEFQERLGNKLKELDLESRVTFEKSTVDSLFLVTGGDWDLAQLYACAAIDRAVVALEYNIQEQMPWRKEPEYEIILVKPHDVENISTDRLERYFSLGESLWAKTIEELNENLTRIANTVIKRRSGQDAILLGELPQTALVDEIQHTENQVDIPFKYPTPSVEEVRAVALHFAQFVSSYTKQPQKVEDHTSSFTFIPRFLIRDRSAQGYNSHNPSYYPSNYMVVSDLGKLVQIQRDPSCVHDVRTLEQYATSLKK